MDSDEDVRLGHEVHLILLAESFHRLGMEVDGGDRGEGGDESGVGGFCKATFGRALAVESASRKNEGRKGAA